MRRSFFAYVYNKGEQKLANTVRPYDLYYTNVGVTFGRPLANRSLMATHGKKDELGVRPFSFISETTSSAMTSAKVHSLGIRSNNAVNSHGFRLRPCRNGVGFAFLQVSGCEYNALPSLCRGKA